MKRTTDEPLAISTNHFFTSRLILLRPAKRQHFPGFLIIRDRSHWVKLSGELLTGADSTWKYILFAYLFLLFGTGMMAGPLATILGHEVTFKMKTLAKDDRAEN